MPTIQATIGQSEAGIFARLWETDNGQMSPEVARIISNLGFSDADKARMHELAAKNQESTLSSEELEELDGYVKVGDLLAILQAKARLLVQEKTAVMDETIDSAVRVSERLLSP